MGSERGGRKSENCRLTAASSEGRKLGSAAIQPLLHARDRRLPAAGPNAEKDGKCRYPAATSYKVNHYEKSRVPSFRKQHCIVAMLHHNIHHTVMKYKSSLKA